MAKYSGLVGYGTQTETSPGIWNTEIAERPMRGDVLSRSRDYVGSDKINDDIEIQQRISIVADPYAYQNFTNILYVTYMGAKWKVTSVEVQRPRLILSMGGLWNGS